MRVYPATTPETFATITPEALAEYGELTDHVGGAAAAARAWNDAGFNEQGAKRWLAARCFAPSAALALSELGVAPEQAAARTRDGDGGMDTIAYKVALGALTPRQGAARSLSSR